jgi:hypothetical protein
LLVPDPFRRLLRNSAQRQNLFVFQFLQASASHSKTHDDAAGLDGVTFPGCLTFIELKVAPCPFPHLQADV